MKLLLALLLATASLVSAEKAAVLLVLTNHGKLGETGKPTGFYLSEAAHPHEVFRSAGRPVVLASPAGGFAPLDPKSLDLDDAENRKFWEAHGNGDAEKPGVEDTVALDGLDPKQYAGIFFAGGHGTMWDFPRSRPLRELTAAIYQGGGAVGAVCHGPAALVNVKPNGTPLVSGRKVAAFTNSEEEAVKLTAVMPFLLEDSLREAGADVRTAADFQENAVRDGRLVTGQNPASARRTAELFLEALDG